MPLKWKMIPSALSESNKSVTLQIAVQLRFVDEQEQPNKDSSSSKEQSTKKEPSMMSKGSSSSPRRLGETKETQTEERTQHSMEKKPDQVDEPQPLNATENILVEPVIEPIAIRT